MPRRNFDYTGPDLGPTSLQMLETGQDTAQSLTSAGMDKFRRLGASSDLLGAGLRDFANALLNRKDNQAEERRLQMQEMGLVSRLGAQEEERARRREAVTGLEELRAQLEPLGTKAGAAADVSGMTEEGLRGLAGALSGEAVQRGVDPRVVEDLIHSSAIGTRLRDILSQQKVQEAREKKVGGETKRLVNIGSPTGKEVEQAVTTLESPTLTTGAFKDEQNNPVPMTDILDEMEGDGRTNFTAATASLARFLIDRTDRLDYASAVNAASRVLMARAVEDTSKEPNLPFGFAVGKSYRFNSSGVDTARKELEIIAERLNAER